MVMKQSNLVLQIRKIHGRIKLKKGMLKKRTQTLSATFVNSVMPRLTNLKLVKKVGENVLKAGEITNEKVTSKGKGFEEQIKRINNDGEQWDMALISIVQVVQWGTWMQSAYSKARRYQDKWVPNK